MKIIYINISILDCDSVLFCVLHEVNIIFLGFHFLLSSFRKGKKKFIFFKTSVDRWNCFFKLSVIFETLG